MINLRITEEEKRNLLKLHGSILNEQGATTNYNICQIQAIIGASQDNIVGPETINKLKERISSKNISNTTPETKTRSTEISPELTTIKQEKGTEVKLGQGQGPENLSTVNNINF
jgi:hypothetical protein